jgi:cytochrome c oxidase assembly protein Cox11
MEMGVRFFIDDKLPADINELTLSYTMFSVGDLDEQAVASHDE